MAIIKGLGGVEVLFLRCDTVLRDLVEVARVEGGNVDVTPTDKWGNWHGEFSVPALLELLDRRMTLRP